MIKYSPNEIVDKVNELSPIDKDSEDGRMKELSVRRLRDFQSKGLVSEPEREGRNVFYTEKHLNELLSLRKLFQDGVSEATIQKMKTDTNNLISTVVTASSYLTSSNVNEKLDSSLYSRGVSAEASSVLNSRENSSSLELLLSSVAPENLKVKNQAKIVGNCLQDNLGVVSGMGLNANFGSRKSLNKSLDKDNVVNKGLTNNVSCKIECTYDLGKDVKLTINSGSVLTTNEKQEIINNFNQVINSL